MHFINVSREFDPCINDLYVHVLQCHRRLLMINCDYFHQNIPIYSKKYKGHSNEWTDGRTHAQT